MSSDDMRRAIKAREKYIKQMKRKVLVRPFEKDTDTFVVGKFIEFKGDDSVEIQYAFKNKDKTIVVRQKIISVAHFKAPGSMSIGDFRKMVTDDVQLRTLRLELDEKIRNEELEKLRAEEQKRNERREAERREAERREAEDNLSTEEESSEEESSEEETTLSESGDDIEEDVSEVDDEDEFNGWAYAIVVLDDGRYFIGQVRADGDKYIVYENETQKTLPGNEVERVLNIDKGKAERYASNEAAAKRYLRHKNIDVTERVHLGPKKDKRLKEEASGLLADLLHGFASMTLGTVSAMQSATSAVARVEQKARKSTAAPRAIPSVGARIVRRKPAKKPSAEERRKRRSDRLRKMLEIQGTERMREGNRILVTNRK